MSVQPIPSGYPTVIPYLFVDAVMEVVTFMEQAFGATVMQRLDRPDGSIMHVEMRLGDAVVMMGEPMGDLEPMPASLYYYVDDSDAVYERALAAGGTSVMEVTTMQHAGERYGGVEDPCGNIWWIATNVEDVPPEEQARRVDEIFGRP